MKATEGGLCSTTDYSIWYKNVCIKNDTTKVYKTHSCFCGDIYSECNSNFHATNFNNSKRLANKNIQEDVLK